MIDWQIGCSGFYYKHWKGSFYPADLPHRKWFDFYCAHFNTLELNASFYRFPKLESLVKLYKSSPATFRFAVKAPRWITHYRQFNNSADMIFDFYTLVREGLREKLACILFQMPERFAFSVERLDKIIESLDNSFINVMEFRHESWWRKDIYDELAKYNISFCGMSHPSLPNDVIANTPFLYYRLHGESQLYASNYEEKRLEHFTDEIYKNTNVNEAYVFFNNDIHTYAVWNAQYMKRYALSQQDKL
jgi:uncharacterized protein YecE (DUF72 family)